jgi:hypothetical protein
MSETVHVGQVAPRTQPVCSETKVTDAGVKPLGTGPPAGPGVGDAVPVGAAVSVAEAVEVGVRAAGAVGEGDFEVVAFVVHAASSIAIATSSARLAWIRLISLFDAWWVTWVPPGRPAGAAP